MRQASAGEHRRHLAKPYIALASGLVLLLLSLAYRVYAGLHIYNFSGQGPLRGINVFLDDGYIYVLMLILIPAVALPVWSLLQASRSRGHFHRSVAAVSLIALAPTLCALYFIVSGALVLGGVLVPPNALYLGWDLWPAADVHYAIP
jgi:hypothetical protein